MAFSFAKVYIKTMKRFFYLGSEKLVRLFVQKVLKKAGHEVYCTDTIDDLFVIKDLDSQVVIVDAVFVSKLSSDFFADQRTYVVLGTELELASLDVPRTVKHLPKPISMDDLLSL